MAKKGPLSKIEKFYIEHNHNNMTVEDFCKTLDRAKGIVKKYVTECKEAEDSGKPDMSGFAHYKGSTVMTQVASEKSDHNRQKSGSKSGRPSCITSMRNNNG